MTVLILSRDERFRSGLELSLNLLGYTAMATGSWEEAQERMREHPIGCVLLEDDWPEDADFDVLSNLMAVKMLSVLVLTDNPKEWREIAALTKGADDYVPKSIGVGALIARILRSTRKKISGQTENFHPLLLVISKEAHTVKVGDRILRLTHKEMNLLEALIRASDAVLSRETLLDRVWGLDSLEFEVRTVDVAIARLRKKLSDLAGINPIETVPGVGYRLRTDQARFEWIAREGEHDLR